VGERSEQVSELAPHVQRWTVAALVSEMTERLRAAEVPEPAQEARELLAAIHDVPRHWPSLAAAELLDAAAWSRALTATSRRASGAPLQYAAGHAAFRHLSLLVDERVLIPRPETELLVDIVLEMTAGDGAAGGTLADVGTGSGALALALASEGHFARVIATDVSADALDVARMNVARCTAVLRAPVELRLGSLLAPVPERGLCAVVSNPPYISYEEASALPANVRDWEPAVALFSGANGMAVTERLVKEAAFALAPRGLLAIEVDVRRAGLVAEAAASHGAYDEVRVLLDLTGRERFVVARRRLEELG
jgi:release factor glutamine methyltransferase